MSLYPIANITDPVGIITYVQTNSTFPYSELVVILTFIIAFIGFKRFETQTAFAGSAFITFLVALLFVAMGVLNNMWLMGSGVLLAISVLLLFFA